MPVQEKGRKRTRIGWFWAHALDDRPWNGPAPPAVVYIYAKSRGNAAIKQQLTGYHGTLQVDGYGAYKSLLKASPRSDMGNRQISLAFCMAHARRKFTDIYKKTASPIARSIFEQIGLLYAVEARIRGTSAEHRLEVRRAETAPLMAALKTMLDDALPQLSAKSALAGAIKYALAHWSGLNLFLHDGRFEIDSNTVERTMRAIAISQTFCPCRARRRHVVSVASVFRADGSMRVYGGSGNRQSRSYRRAPRRGDCRSGLDVGSRRLRGVQLGQPSCHRGGARRSP